MIFVSSWDDGHPLDERLGELLGRFDLVGTFYVPIRNREGFPVMSAESVRRLGMHHEIGSHTLDHLYLRPQEPATIRTQVRDGKHALEDLLGRSVPGFCYPGGRYDAVTVAAVREAGFEHARTVENLIVDVPHDPFMVPTTLQFFPHRRSALVRNLLKYGRRVLKLPLFLRLVSAPGFTERLQIVLEYARACDGVLHVWGHSWELERYDLWGALESFLEEVAAMKPRSMGVQELTASSGRSRG